MACLHIARSPFLGFRFDFGRKSGSFLSDFDHKEEKRVFQLRKRRHCKSLQVRGFRVVCRVEEGENKSNAEEPPESLFMKELKRKGNRSLYGAGENEIKLKEDSGGISKRSGVVSTEYEKDLANQRERSMALNSEGLEGLIPRAKLLLTLGGTFFLGFWPLILVTVTFFSALYFYFGPGFVHDASKTPVAPPPYIDPYELLEDERISQSAPHIK
ncbi:Ribosomal RNA large subunit methyltransferase H [Cinnamomum micranthum f. kanehirae]|uniref:Ribosomal RNA large subunit methyltransferase H n=1 Tax=Cinnamomum micranthum f. kanehirae TaxID=337451 RepID=A0A3S3MSH4_9MAGN|nr:Ribosomal RNA large subunit methyltransferase H [Cinnamomum micranthum f. kanehirae]